MAILRFKHPNDKKEIKKYVDIQKRSNLLIILNTVLSLLLIGSLVLNILR